MNEKYRFIKRTVSLAVFLYLFCSFLLLSSCSINLSQLFGNWNPRGDWTYDLVGDYSIYRINSATISLVKVRQVDKDVEVGDNVIESYITSFAYNDRFIAVRQLDVPLEYSQEDILKMDFDQAKYFVVDITTDQVYGPYYSVEHFQIKCDELKVGSLCGWINTYPDPEGATY